MSWINDSDDLGFFPLQDHQDKVPIGMRRRMAGLRIRYAPDPKSNLDVEESLTEYAKEGRLGTIGDVHPWSYWQTRDRADRDMGSWSMLWAGLTTGGGTIPPRPGRTSTHQEKPTKAHPVRFNDMRADERYVSKEPGWQECFPSLAHGVAVLVAPATEERAQHDLMYQADPRLFCPSVGGPGTTGTIVVDMQPDLEPCMDGAASPGKGGRHARIQSMMRVVALSKRRGIRNLDGTAAGNSLAWNLSLSGQDGLAGYGMVWAPMDKFQAGPVTGHPSSPGGPVTPSGNPDDPTTGRARNNRITLPSSSSAGAGAGAAGGGGGGGGGGGASPPIAGGMPGAAGGPPTPPGPVGPPRAPVVGKAPCDFGEFSQAPVNAHGVSFMGHVGAFGPFHAGHHGSDKHQIDRDKDGNPMNSGHLSIDAYWYEDKRKDGPMLFEDYFPDKVRHFPLKSFVHCEFDEKVAHKWIKGTKKGKWRWWAEVPSYAPPKKKRGPDPVPPRRPGGPSTPGGPNGPGVPTTPGSKPPTTTPGGGRGGGGGPTTGGSGAGPTTGGGGGRSSIGRILDNLRSGRGGPGGTQFDPGGSPGRGGGPIPGSTSNFDLLDQSGRNLAFGLDEPPTAAVTLDRVGDTEREDVGLYSIHHPMMMSFAAMSFRPQKWTMGEPSYVHNPDRTTEEIALDEITRPTILAVDSWGAQYGDGSWIYTDDPKVSRARGGTSSGGILIHPPHLEMEDYFSLGVDKGIAATKTTSYVTLAPNVALGLGVPNTSQNGSLGATSVIIGQSPIGANRVFNITQNDTTGLPVVLFAGQLSQSTNEVVVNVGTGGNQAVRIPRGTTAQRQSTISATGGELRINTDRTSSTDTPEYYNAQTASWDELGSGGVDNWIDLTDTDPTTYVGGALKHIRVNAAEDGLEFRDASLDFASVDAVPLLEEAMLLDGSNNMAANMNIGGFAITNVGNVDGRDVSADGSTLDTHVAATAPHTGVLDLAGARIMTGDIQSNTVSTFQFLAPTGAIKIDAGLTNTIEGSAVTLSAITGDIEFTAGSGVVKPNAAIEFGATSGSRITSFSGTDLELYGGAGVTIDTGTAPLVIQGNAHIEADEETTPTTPTGSRTGLAYDSGEWWFYDTVRTKWLSLFEYAVMYAKKGTITVATNLLAPGQANGQTMGFLCPASCVLTGYHFKINSGTVTASGTNMEIKRNTTVLHTIVFSATGVLSDYTMNTDLTAGWSLYGKCDPTPGGDSPSDMSATFYVRKKRP